MRVTDGNGQSSTKAFSLTNNALAVVTVQANPANGGTVSGGWTFPVGSQQPIAASAATGFVFAAWDDGNTDNPRTVTVPVPARMPCSLWVSGRQQPPGLGLQALVFLRQLLSWSRQDWHSPSLPHG